MASSAGRGGGGGSVAGGGGGTAAVAVGAAFQAVAVPVNGAGAGEALRLCDLLSFLPDLLPLGLLVLSPFSLLSLLLFFSFGLSRGLLLRPLLSLSFSLSLPLLLLRSRSFSPRGECLLPRGESCVDESSTGDTPALLGDPERTASTNSGGGSGV